MPDEHAVLVEHEGRLTLRFQRLLPQPPERVWLALTEREQLSAWHPTPFLIEPDSGKVAFVAAAGAPPMPAGRLLALRPPALLAYTWGEDELRFTLEPAQEGACLLTLEHSFSDRLKAARDGAGWHLCLAALALVLEGRPTPEGGSAESPPEGWRELNADYQRRFGIDPAQATPIPPM